MDNEAVAWVANQLVEQIVEDLDFMALAKREWGTLTREERTDLATGWRALIAEELL